MARRPAGLSAEDQAAWAALARGVRRLRPGVAAEPPDPPSAASSSTASASPIPQAPARPGRAVRPVAPLSVGAAPAGLDKASWQRFRAGTLVAERRLDLHAHTAQAAFGALDAFLRRAHADGVRCVEVITGRGRDGAGVLRREVPLWLNGPGLRPLLLAVAHPHAANDGSLRLLLRRARR